MFLDGADFLKLKMHKIIIEFVWGMPEAPTIRQEIGVSALRNPWDT